MPNPLELPDTGSGGATNQNSQGWIRRGGGVRQNPWGGGVTLEGGGYTGAVGGIDPVDVRNPTPDWNNFNQFGDATYSAATRQLDPYWQQQEDAFRQRMVGQGLSEGTDAYNTAWDQFSRSRNDAYTQARTQSLADALAAQGQAWGQNFQESQLANALAQSRLSADASITGANIGAGASMYGNDLQRLNFLDQLGFNGQQADFQNLMSMYGFDQGVTGQNNAALGQDRSATMPWLNLIPGVNPSQIDTQSPYNNQYNSQMAGWQADQQRQAQQQSQYMALIGAMFCSETLKDAGAEQTPETLLEVVKQTPVYEWSYKWENVRHVSPMAEAFNRNLHGEARPVIAVQDAFGTLMGAVKALLDRVEKLEARYA